MKAGVILAGLGVTAVAILLLSSTAGLSPPSAEAQQPPLPKGPRTALEEEIVNLQLHERKLLADYGPNHPEVQAVRKHLETVRKLVAQRAEPEPKRPEGGHGPFAVAASGETAVLLDTASGQTWVLHRPAQGGAVWVPARRLDSERETREWLEEERARRAALERRSLASHEEAYKETQRREMKEMLRRAREDRERAQKALDEAERRLRELEQGQKSRGH